MTQDSETGTSNRIRIGIDLGGTKIETLALSPAGEEKIRFRIPTPRQDYHATVRSLADAVHKISANLASDTKSITVGIGMPGSISPATGRVQNANSTWLNGKPFQSDLASVIRFPIRLANDADCFTISEATDGAGKNARSVFGVIIGTGLGGAYTFDKKLIAGPRGTAGEWGHNSLPWPRGNEIPGPKCWCGRNGCLEAWLSGPAVLKDYEARTGRTETLNATEIAQRATNGDVIAQAVMADHHCRFARGLAHIINILDPDVIVIGGGLSAIPSLYEELPKLMRPHVFSDTPNVIVKPPVWGDASGVRGAAWLWD